MVVDRAPLHPYQADILLFTLERFAGVPRESVVVQCTNRVSAAVRETFEANGYAVATLVPYLDGKYCNKIAQLDHLVESEDDGIEGVFLLDLDLAVAAPLDIADPAVVWGKPVDADSPPLPALQKVFAAAGVALPPTLACDWPNRGDSIATNFNGGFLYVPASGLRALRTAWRAWAEFLFSRPEVFDPPSARHHIDQISFAMALAAEGTPYRHLATNWNFPCHNAKALPPRRFEASEPLRVVHYHDCLDEFGLVAPRLQGFAPLDAALDTVNAAIGEREDALFFESYKRHLALEAASRVPAVSKPLFSPEFVARTWIGEKKRRLILHAGTPKTGTSSLQHHLGMHRDALARHGWWYPKPSDTPEPKHQQINDLLMWGDEEAFARHIEDALRDMPDETHTIVFTTEGIYNQWWDYRPAVKGALRHLAALFDFDLCVWFRQPDDFAASLYTQYLTNPPSRNAPRNVYGRDIGFVEALADPWFRRHLDYLGFYLEVQQLFGQGRVSTFAYAGDTVQAFFEYYGVSGPPPGRSRRNPSLSRGAIDFVRVANRVLLEKGERARVMKLIHEIQDIIGDRVGGLQLDEDERRKVARLTGAGWRVLDPMLSARGRTARPRSLKPKVFGIGFHKTGTKSLRKALATLGYQVTGPDGAQDPAIADRALAMALCLATEHDGFSDNPWPLLYRELDIAFPGSRFVLTVRDESQWIESVVRFFGAVETPMREWIYGIGTPVGNETTYLARYRRHNAEVVEYFRGREDLLVMDLEGGDGWKELCGFLGVAIPASPFPHVQPPPR